MVEYVLAKDDKDETGVRLGMEGTHSDGAKPQDLLRFLPRNPKGVQVL